MNSFKYIIILVIFLKTGNVLSKNNLFNVNNIEITKKASSNNEIFANQAIKQGFNELIDRVLLKEDISKLENLDFTTIKNLVSYYQITGEQKDSKAKTKKFNIFFDKDKLHNLFFTKGISYSDILKNELYLLPILKKQDQLYIYSQNFFYENWNKSNEDEILEFNLPLENIETIQKINIYKNNLLGLDLRDIFLEYTQKNLALVLINDTGSLEEKVFLKTIIMGKSINKNLLVKRFNFSEDEFYENIIFNVKKEIVNLAKSQNLIDISTPSFLNTKFKLDKKNNNLVELRKRINNIDLIENIYVQEFNNEYVLLKIKYLGKIDKIIDQLKEQKILLSITQDMWSLKFI